MPPKISAEIVLAALSKVQEPELHKDLVTLNMIRDLEIREAAVSFTILLTTPACPLKSSIEKAAREAVLGILGVKTVNIKMDSSVPGDGRLRGLMQLPVRNAIAIASGKGGVGKSTVAGVNGRLSITSLSENSSSVSSPGILFTTKVSSASSDFTSGF